MHYNIQFSVQQVGTEGVETAPRRGEAVRVARRVTVELLSLKVTARTEAEAYAKAAVMLAAAAPSVAGPPIDGVPSDDEEDEL